MDLSNYHLPQLKKVKVDKQPTLLKPDFSLLKKMICPIHSSRLYWTHDKSKVVCKVGKHIFSKAVMSGERLEEWKRLNKEMLK